MVVGVWRDGEVSLDAAGVTAPGGSTPMTADTLTRISSNTKPMAVADNPAPAAKAAGRVPVVALSSLSAPSGAHKG